MLKRENPDSDGRLETMEASSSAAALVVENDSTEQPQSDCPESDKIQAKKAKHKEVCRKSRLRIKARKEKMETDMEAMQLELQELKKQYAELINRCSELINQNISYQERMSKLESDLRAANSDLQAANRLLQQQDEEIGRLKQSPSEWPFEELREQGIGNADDVQEYLLESANYKQDGQDPGNESGNWAALGLTLSDLDDLDIIQGSATNDTNSSIYDSVSNL